jgi:hypothetical protein
MVLWQVLAQNESAAQARVLSETQAADVRAALEAKLASATAQSEVQTRAHQATVAAMQAQVAAVEEDCRRQVAAVREEAAQLTPAILYDEHVTELQLQLREANLVAQQLQRRLQTAGWELQEQEERAERAAHDARARLQDLESARDAVLEEQGVRMDELVATLRQVEDNFVEQRRQFEVALKTQAARLGEDHQHSLEQQLKEAAAQARADAEASFRWVLCQGCYVRAGRGRVSVVQVGGKGAGVVRCGACGHV